MTETPKRGRPPLKDRMEQITIKLPPKMIVELKALSTNTGNPTSFHIRQAIAEYLGKNNQ